MDITTSPDFVGVVDGLPDGDGFTVLQYADGSITRIADDCFQGWRGQDVSDDDLPFAIGKGTMLGAGSIVRCAGRGWRVSIGNWTAIGQRVRFLLGGMHRMNTAAIADFHLVTLPGSGVDSPYARTSNQRIEVGHDVWIGDEAFIMVGSTIPTGCVLGARTLVPMNATLEPYGVYVGTPAKLVRFRFPEAVRAALLDLAWWEMPLGWIREHNALLMADLESDEAMALDVIAALADAKAAWLTTQRVRSGVPAGHA